MRGPAHCRELLDGGRNRETRRRPPADRHDGGVGQRREQHRVGHDAYRRRIENHQIELLARLLDQLLQEVRTQNHAREANAAAGREEHETGGHVEMERLLWRGPAFPQPLDDAMLARLAEAPGNLRMPEIAVDQQDALPLHAARRPSAVARAVLPSPGTAEVTSTTCLSLTRLRAGKGRADRLNRIGKARCRLLDHRYGGVMVADAPNGVSGISPSTVIPWIRSRSVESR